MILKEFAKLESEKFIRKHGLDAPPHLPFLDDPDELNPPTSEQVARRLLVLAYLIAISFDIEGDEIINHLKSFKLWRDVTVKEKALLQKPAFSEEDKNNASWLTECTEVLGWALGMTEIDHFSEAKEDYLDHIPIRSDPQEFIKKSKLRAFQEIYMQADLICRLYWIASDASSKGLQCPIDSELCYERYRAIIWLVGKDGHWDEI
jgi:hypothetical protein